MRWEENQVWMELKELIEKMQEKSQDEAVLSGLEHSDATEGTGGCQPIPEHQGLSGAPLQHREGRRCGFDGTEQEQGRADKVKGSASGAELCRQRVKQLEREDKPTSMAAGSPRDGGREVTGRAAVAGLGSLCEKWPQAPGRF